MTQQGKNVRAFVSDDEGFFLFKNIKFQIHEHVAELLAAMHAQRAHPVTWPPMSYNKWKRNLGRVEFSLAENSPHIPHVIGQRDG